MPGQSPSHDGDDVTGPSKQTKCELVPPPEPSVETAIQYPPLPMAPKSILITGCSKGGIGDGLAREFKSRGLRVFAAGRDPAKLAHLHDLGITVLVLDVTDPASVATAAESVRRAINADDGGGGRGLDILINNAGVNHCMPLADCALDDIRRVFDANVIGVFAVTQAFLPLLIEAKGTVANIGSVNEVFTPPFQAAYNASKAALSAFSDTVRTELLPFGVKVVHVRTGAVRSNLFGAERPGAKMPADSMYSPCRSIVEDHSFLDGVKFATPEEYAKEVASDLLGNPGPVLWRGPNAFIARLMSWFAWPGMMVSVVWALVAAF
jgi:1-acylglycerone phosphate reductase